MPETARSRAEGSLDIERAAVVEITSEEKDYPIESAFISGDTRGWRAAEYVQRIDRSAVETTVKRNLALAMRRLTAEDVVSSLANSRCTPELVPVQVSE